MEASKADEREEQDEQDEKGTKDAKGEKDERSNGKSDEPKATRPEEKEDKEEEKKPFLAPKELTIGEFVGMISALILAGSLWLPWFSTSSNPNSTIGTGPELVARSNSEATAREVFTLLDWTLLAGCTAPFILAWIIMRGHSLNWRPGEVTMVIGMTAFVLVLCNGVILGKPEPGIEISLAIGWFVGLVASFGMIVGGFLRQALHTDAKKPPGVL